MEFLVTSSEQPHDMLENALQTQLPPGITDVELGEIHVHEGTYISEPRRVQNGLHVLMKTKDPKRSAK